MPTIAGPSGVPRKRPVREFLDEKAGDPCGYAYCPGHLERTCYKGDEALVCDRCEAPAIRVW